MREIKEKLAASPKEIATRTACEFALESLIPALPEMIGGSADLTGSNNTRTKSMTAITPNDFSGRFIHYGIREHGMAAAMNGMTLHGGIIPYSGTFLVFSDYCRPSIRLAALMSERVIHVMTHDSIGLGEDGPTHQPVEQLASLRAMPGMVVLRPGDANEVVEAWKATLQMKHEPVSMVLTRQALPTLDRNKYAAAAGLAKGGYVLAESQGKPDLILIGTGSELSLCVAAYEKLTAEGTRVRVVSLPSWELFEKQTQAYRDSVLPPDVRARVSVEAGSVFGWERYVGLDGAILGMTTFGASAPAKDLFKKYGFTVEHVLEAARGVLARKK